MSSHSREFEGDLAAGQMLGRYELLLPIASGGMGKVWAARLRGARGFRKIVAVKTILNVTDARHSQMLLDEATLASQIQHPNVAETIELGEHEGKLYSVMELVDGESLGSILREARERGGVPLPVGVNLVGQICRGLQAAHDLTDRQGKRIGLVHRDVSPPNVLVTYSGVVKLIDFGVAMTSAGQDSESDEVRGKVSYFAPEQLRAQPLDARVDVFAAGILLYLLTTDRHPFRGNSEDETVRRIVSAALAPQPSSFLEDYPVDLEEVLLRALEKDRDRRYPSASALLDALEHALPSAFGPAGDRVTAEYVRVLLQDRMLERRRLLRAAEDFSESSSPCASVPAVARAVRSAPANAHHHSRAGSLALMVLALMFVGAMLNRQRIWSTDSGASTAPRFMAAAAQEATRLHTASALGAPVASPAPEPTPSVTQSPTPVALPAPPALALTKRAAPSALPVAEPAEQRRIAWTPPPEPVERAAAPDDGAALRVGSGLETLAPAPQASAAPPAQHGLVAAAPESAKPPKLKQVGSRVGHAQLAIDPLSTPYRVEVTPIMQRAGQSSSASVSVCVGVSGNVTSARLQSAASPTLGARVVSAVSRWKYRPLLEGGQAVPFCYLLRYQLTGR